MPRARGALLPASAEIFAAPMTACVVLALLARRRWPFAAPVAMWGSAAARSRSEWILMSPRWR